MACTERTLMIVSSSDSDDLSPDSIDHLAEYAISEGYSNIGAVLLCDRAARETRYCQVDGGIMDVSEDELAVYLLERLHRPSRYDDLVEILFTYELFCAIIVFDMDAPPERRVYCVTHGTNIKN